MAIRFHPHDRERLAERGATEREISATVSQGAPFAAKFGRAGFRRNFPFAGNWGGNYYANKQVIVYAVRDGQDGPVITVITKFF